MIELTQARVEDVLAYMEDDLPNCLYLYGDIVRYGINDPNMTVWFSEKDGKINAVVMKYFSGSHVYSKHLDFDPEEVVAQLQEFGPDRISSQKEVIETLYPVLCDEYDVEYGVVIKHRHRQRRMRPPVPVERAKPEDAEAIAELMMTDEVWSKTYDKKQLAAEIADRIRSGIGRSYIMREGDRIVAHNSANLETDRYVIESLFIIHSNYREKMYGSYLQAHFANDISEEGKEPYSMVFEEHLIRSFERLGATVQTHYGKLYRRALDEE